MLDVILVQYVFYWRWQVYKTNKATAARRCGSKEETRRAEEREGTTYCWLFERLLQIAGWENIGSKPWKMYWKAAWLPVSVNK